MKNIIPVSIFAILFLFSACRKDFTDVTITTDETPPIVLIKSSVRGIVVDESGAVLSGAIVEVGGKKTVSGPKGRFHFQNITIEKEENLVTADQIGYFQGASQSGFSAEGSSFVEIRLLNKGTANSVSAPSGGSFTTNEAMKINIPPEALVFTNGDPYYGNVEVYSRWLDPTAEDLGGIMPGALTATDPDGNPLALASYGMLALSLETPNGTELKIEDGQAISVEIPIPAALLSSAPETIDLWQYDLEEGQWLLQGTCKKEGGAYKCQVSSTGYWNCDVALPAICLSGNIFNADGSFASYVKVVVEDLTDNFIYWGYTDSMGYFCGSVPQAAFLRLYIKDHCDNVLYTADIGPFSEDTELDDIYLDQLVESFLIQLNGTAMHCSLPDTPSGHIAVRYPGRLRVFPYENGVFDFPVAFNCLAFPEMEITAYTTNSGTLEVGTTVFHDEFTDLNMGLQQTCEMVSDSFSIVADGNRYTLAPTQYYFKNNVTTGWLLIEGIGGGGKFTIEIRDYQGLMTYGSGVFFRSTSTAPLPIYPQLSASSPDVSVTVTGDDGTFISGTLTGMAKDPFGTELPVSIDFNVRKAP